MAKSTDPIQMLKRDHERVRELLAQAVDSEGDSDVLTELVEAVEAHTSLEEELVYPAFYEAAGGTEEERLYFESLEEHALVESVLAEMDPEALEPEVLMAKIKVTRDLINHHVEEEEKELFPLMRELLTKEQLDDLGASMQESSEPRGRRRTARGTGSPWAESGKGARVDLNSASTEELQQIKGIDGIRTDRLVQYRKSHGPFQSWEEVAEVEGFDDGMIRAMRSQSDLGR